MNPLMRADADAKSTAVVFDSETEVAFAAAVASGGKHTVSTSMILLPRDLAGFSEPLKFEPAECDVWRQGFDCVVGGVDVAYGQPGFAVQLLQYLQPIHAFLLHHVRAASTVTKPVHELLHIIVDAFNETWNRDHCHQCLFSMKSGYNTSFFLKQQLNMVAQRVVHADWNGSTYLHGSPKEG